MGQPAALPESPHQGNAAGVDRSAIFLSFLVGQVRCAPGIEFGLEWAVLGVKKRPLHKICKRWGHG
jgi:hypothetical protein